MTTRRPLHTSSQLGNLRTAAGLTQEAVAQELAVHQTAIANWEAGRYPPGLGRIARLSELYRASEDAIREAIGNDRRRYARAILRRRTA